ncbi:DsbA family oxidoreductase [Actinacidiphila acididurans]|uniref:DsbA family oxidoreductase n=1 Tax=Actinacidiphila acididurans TaxID=2784346 RepID=A0ABS2TWX2_9ACTN|nr:DsbA family oxidoreductase [Actinacidiphila acididurans]MBM9507466.1 DsbA family oxidoreductase [Actinacidiphila acididurans]
MKVDFYSDIGCVWCYISMHRLKRALERFPGADRVEVIHRPFQLDPSLPTEAKPHLEFLDGLFGPQQAAQIVERVTRITGRDGIPYNPRTALSSNTLLAHRLLRLAELEHGRRTQTELKARMYAARFAEGGDIGDVAQLADMAVGVGMDRTRVAAYLASDEGAKEIREQVDAARAMGVSSVPTFVVDGKWSVSGAQEVAVFVQLLERAAADGADAEDGAAGEEAFTC